MTSFQIFEHDPKAITPLLKAHLPASIFAYGALVTPSPAKPYDHVVRVWSSIPLQLDGKPISLDAQGTIIVALPPASGQLRIFDTLESTLNPESDENKAAQGMSEDDQGQREEGKQRVVAALKAYITDVERQPKMVGAVNALWAVAVIKDLKGAPNPPGNVWLPTPAFYRALAGAEGGGQVYGAPVEGYAAGPGREEDIAEFAKNSGIVRHPSYFPSRIAWSTVIRPIRSGLPTDELPTPVCHMYTHADGSLGGLYTHADHRRKGLAQWIVRAHLGSGRGWAGGEDAGDERWTCAVIFDHHIESQGCFRSLGFEKAWGCPWVLINPQQVAKESKVE